MLFGLFFSLKTFTAAMDPKGCACRARVRACVRACVCTCVWLHCSLRLLSKHVSVQGEGSPAGCTAEDWGGLLLPHLLHEQLQAALPRVPVRHQGALCCIKLLLLLGLAELKQLCVQIVLTTPPEIGDLREALAYVYGHIYVEFIGKNPLHSPGQPFRYEARAGALCKQASGAADFRICVQLGALCDPAQRVLGQIL